MYPLTALLQEYEALTFRFDQLDGKELVGHEHAQRVEGEDRREAIRCTASFTAPVCSTRAMER